MSTAPDHLYLRDRNGNPNHNPWSPSFSFEPGNTSFGCKYSVRDIPSRGANLQVLSIYAKSGHTELSVAPQMILGDGWKLGDVGSL